MDISNSILLQWGKKANPTPSSTSTTTLTFNLSFSKACYLNLIGKVWGQQADSYGMENLTQSSATIYYSRFNEYLYWHAIGY